MRFFQSSQDRDVELLSAYLDDELAAGERDKLERRLKADANLRLTLAGLRRVQAALSAAPAVKPPHSFTLTPAMAGRPARQPPAARFLPALNLATSIAAILFAVVVASQVATSKPAAAPAPSAAESQASSQSQPIQAQAPLAPKSVTGTPPVTEYPTTFAQIAPCDTQEPLTGGGCSGAPSLGPGVGGGSASAGGASVAPYAPVSGVTAASDAAANATGAPEAATAGPAGPLRVANDTAPAGGETQPAADQTVNGAAPAPATPAAHDTVAAQDTAAAPGAVSAPAEAEAAPLSPARAVTFALGGLLVLLIAASIFARRQ
jgi:hypothetical protein